MHFFIELSRLKRQRKLVQEWSEVLPVTYDNIGMAICDGVMLAAARNLGVTSFASSFARGRCIIELKDAAAPKLKLTRARGR